MGEAGDLFCSAEDRPVGFGAVGSSQRNVGGSVDGRIAHLLLETTINERYFNAENPNGILAPVLTLGQIYNLARSKGWIDGSQRPQRGKLPPLMSPRLLALD